MRKEEFMQLHIFIGLIREMNFKQKFTTNRKYYSITVNSFIHIFLHIMYIFVTLNFLQIHKHFQYNYKVAIKLKILISFY